MTIAMKKIILVFFTMASSLVIVCCSDNKSAESHQPQDNVSGTAAVSTDIAESQDFSVNAKKAEVAPVPVIQCGEPVGVPSKPDQTKGWNIYRDDMNCYGFQYPGNYLIKEERTSDGWPLFPLLLKPENDKEWFIEGDVRDASSYEFAEKNFEEFIFDMAKMMYAADGADGSSFVVDLVNKRRFLASNQLDAMEFDAVIQHDIYHYSDDDEVTIESEKVPEGPLYAISISGPGEPQRVLFMRHRSRSNGPNDKALRDNAALRAIAETVWTFPSAPVAH